MKKYYINRNDGNITLGCGDSLGGEEITKEEYDALLAEVRAKINFANKLYAGEIAIEDIPAEWQEEIQGRVEERIKAEAEAAEIEEE